MKEKIDKHFDFMREFFSDMENQEPLYIFIKGHLYLESIMSKMLVDFFPNTPKMNIFNFSQKLELIRSIGFIELETYQAISKVNRLRNKLAHDLKMDLDEGVIEDIIDLLPQNVKKYIFQRIKETSETKVKSLFWGLFNYLLFNLEYPHLSFYLKDKSVNFLKDTYNIDKCNKQDNFL